jgi:hypothetical protein
MDRRHVATVSKICRGFNGILKRIVGDIKRAYPSDVKVIRTHKALSLLSDAGPIDTMKKTGKYLYKYRKQIMIGGDFFNTHDFGADLDGISDSDEADLTGYIIAKVRELAPSLTKEERGLYLDSVRDMLDYYLEYLELCHDKS